MQNDLERHHAPFKLAVVQPLRDLPETAESEAPRSLGQSTGAFGSLRRWMLRARLARRDRVDAEPLDDHTLNDIGMTRFELIYWTRK